MMGIEIRRDVSAALALDEHSRPRLRGQSPRISSSANTRRRSQPA